MQPHPRHPPDLSFDPMTPFDLDLDLNKWWAVLTSEYKAHGGLPTQTLGYCPKQCQKGAGGIYTHDSGTCSRFHSGTIREKDCLYCSDCERMCLYVWGWFLRVRWSARVRMSSTSMATLQLMILKSRARQSSRLRCTSGAHCRSCRRLVMLFLMSYFYLTNLAPRRWIISRALMSLARWGFQAVALYSRRDLTSEMKALSSSEMKALACSSVSCTGQCCKFLRSKPMMLFALEDTLCVCLVQLKSSLIEYS